MITEKEILLKEAKFYSSLAAKVEELRVGMYGINRSMPHNGVEFPIERLEKNDKFPVFIELFNEQFKALYHNLNRVSGEMHQLAFKQEEK